MSRETPVISKKERRKQVKAWLSGVYDDPGVGFSYARQCVPIRPVEVLECQFCHAPLTKDTIRYDKFNAIAACEPCLSRLDDATKKIKGLRKRRAKSR